MSILEATPPTEAQEAQPVTEQNPATPAQAEVNPSILNEDGSFSPSFYESEKLVDYKATLERYKSPEALGEAYMNLKKLVGGKGIPTPPVNDADPQALATYRQVNGIPDTADGYELTVPENLPEGIEMPEGALEQYKEVAHSLNLTPDQGQALMNAHIAREAELQQQYIAQQKQYEVEQTARLKKDWGADFDLNKGKAQAAFNSLALKAGVDMTDSPLLGDPRFVKLMHAVSGMIGEGNITPNNFKQSGITLAEANRIMTDTTHPDNKAFYNPNDPRNSEVVAKVNEGLSSK